MICKWKTYHAGKIPTAVRDNMLKVACPKTRQPMFQENYTL